jgi:hypothetical protein
MIGAIFAPTLQTMTNNAAATNPTGTAMIKSPRGVARLPTAFASGTTERIPSAPTSGGRRT